MTLFRVFALVRRTKRLAHDKAAVEAAKRQDPLAMKTLDSLAMRRQVPLTMKRQDLLVRASFSAPLAFVLILFIVV